MAIQDVWSLTVCPSQTHAETQSLTLCVNVCGRGAIGKPLRWIKSWGWCLHDSIDVFIRREGANWGCSVLPCNALCPSPSTTVRSFSDEGREMRWSIRSQFKSVSIESSSVSRVFCALMQPIPIGPEVLSLTALSLTVFSLCFPRDI